MLQFQHAAPTETSATVCASNPVAADKNPLAEEPDAPLGHGTTCLVGQGRPLNSFNIAGASSTVRFEAVMSVPSAQGTIHLWPIALRNTPASTMIVYAHSVAQQYRFAVACYLLWKIPFPADLCDQFVRSALNPRTSVALTSNVADRSPPVVDILFDLFKIGNQQLQSTIICGLNATPTSLLLAKPFSHVWLGQVLQFFKTSNNPKYQGDALYLLVQQLYC